MKLKPANKYTNSELIKIMKESYESLSVLCDYFFPSIKQDPDDGTKVQDATVHKEFDKLLRESVKTKRNNKSYNLVGILPRGIGKSTYANRLFLIFCLLFTNKQHIIMIGGSKESIKGHFASLKYEIENNKLLHIFGIKPVPGESKNADEFVVYAPSKPGMLYDGGIGRTVIIKNYSFATYKRGLTRGSSRPDLFIIDDLENKGKGNKSGVENPKYRAQMKEFFYSEVIPSGGKSGSMQIIMIGTTLHEDQLLYTLYKDSQAGTSYPKFKSIKYSMIENYGTPEAYSIWPWKLTLEEFNSMMDAAILKGNQTWIYNEYLSLPISPEIEIFKSEDFKYYRKQAGRLIENSILDDKVVVQLQDCDIVVTSDLAFTIKERSDFSAFIICAIDKKNNIFILDTIVGKWLLSGITTVVSDIIKKYRPSVFGMESANAGTVIIQTLEKHFINNEYWPGITELKSGGIKKQDRIINALQIPYNEGKIFHLEGAKYLGELEYQIVSITKESINCAHDDIVDALAYIPDLIDEDRIYASISDDDDYEIDYYTPSTYIF